MVRQTQVNGNSIHDRSARKGLRRSISDLSNDVMSLAELQWQLFVHDCRSSVRQTVRPLILAIMGALLCVCGIPIALLGAAYGLVEAGVSMAWALLLVAAAAIVLGGTLTYLGSSAAARAAACFDRSRSELRDNVAWLKQAAKHARNHEPLN